VVHTDGMTTTPKVIRQSVSLPSKLARQVQTMAKQKRVSANRMLVELVEEGIELKKQKEKAFFELAERFRTATDPKEIQQLGDEMGKMVFGK
jgi:hypothetical protein